MSKANFLCEELLPEGAESALLQHTYKGGSDSLLYKYATGPLAGFLVDSLVPLKLA